MIRLLTALVLTGCSVGPQVPNTVPVVNVACTWNTSDGGTCTHCQCRIDRSQAEAKPTTTGNRVEGIELRVDAGVRTETGQGSQTDS